MAISQPTALVQQVRNKVADQVFYVRNGVTYARARVSPDQTRTTARDLNRLRLAAVTTAYKSDLTRTQRLAWREAAKTIGPRPHRSGYGKLTGQMYYFNVNLVMANLGKPFLADPPTRRPPDPITAFSVHTLDSSTPEILLDLEGATGSNTHIIVYSTGNVAPGRLSANGTTRQIQVFPPGSPRPLDITAAWGDKFGTLTAGQRVVFQAATASDLDGQLSPRAYATAIATGATNVPWTLISEVELSAASPSIDFNSIPQTYTHLAIFLSCSTDNSALDDQVSLQFNGDTATNYQFMQRYVGTTSGNPANSSATAIDVQMCNGAGSGYALLATGDIFIPNYRTARNPKPVFCDGNYFRNYGGVLWRYSHMGMWRSAAAITDIKLIPKAGPNLVANSIAQLYGI